MWKILSIILVAGVYWTNGAPDGFQEAVDTGKVMIMNGMGVAMEMAQDFHAGGGGEAEMDLGPMHMKKKVDAGVGHAPTASDSSEEDRKRRRRSVVINESSSAEKQRIRRSPCNRKQQLRGTTTPAGADGGAPDADGNIPPTDATTNEGDIPRRRKRSTHENEIDENAEIVPAGNFGDNAQNVSEKFRQIIKNMIDAMRGMMEGIASAFRGNTDNQQTKK